MIIYVKLDLLIKFSIFVNIKPLYLNNIVYDYVNCDYNIIRKSLSNIKFLCSTIYTLMMQLMSFMIMFLKLFIVIVGKKTVLLVNTLYSLVKC